VLVLSLRRMPGRVEVELPAFEPAPPPAANVEATLPR